MAKTQEELYAIKEEVEALNNKLKELTEDELKLVSGGILPRKRDNCFTDYVRCNVCGREYPVSIRVDDCGGLRLDVTADYTCPSCGAWNYTLIR